MGRFTTILACNIYDADLGENPCLVDNHFIEELNKKYSIDYKWKFRDDGSIEFNGTGGYGGSTVNMNGEPENMIKALLETAKHYNRVISGTFSYDDNKSGGSSHSLVFIAKDYTAVIYEYDTDINIESLSMLKNPMATMITLDISNFRLKENSKDKYQTNFSLAFIHTPELKDAPFIPCDWK